MLEEFLHTNFLPLVTNLGLLAFAAWACITIYRKSSSDDHRQDVVRPIALGMSFGLVAIMLMNLPFKLTDGIFADSRAVPILLSGIYGGPIAGFITGAAALVTRLWLGGAGMLSGVTYIVVMTLFGIAIYYRAYDRLNGTYSNGAVSAPPERFSLLKLVIYGIVATTLTLPAIWLLPNEAQMKALVTLWPQMYIANVIGVVLVSSMIETELKRAEAIKGLEHSFETLEKQKQSLVDLINSIPAETALLDETGKVCYVNQTWIDNMPDQASLENFIGKNYLEVIASAEDTDSELQKLHSGLQEIIRGYRGFFDAQYFCMKDTGPSWYKLVARSLNADVGYSALIMHFDITDLVESQNQLRAIQEDLKQKVLQRTQSLKEEVKAKEAAQEFRQLYAEAFNKSIEPMVITDRDYNVIDTNNAFESLTEFRYKDFKKDLFHYIQNDRNPEDFDLDIQHELNTKGSWQGEYWISCNDGHSTPCWFTATRVSLYSQNYFFVSLIDISDRKAEEEKMKEMAHQDPLTGALNRVSLDIELAFAIKQAKRHKNILGVLFIDLDNFKNINDQYGHAMGDALLKKATKRIKAEVREGDIVSRIGGDEFVVVLTDQESVEFIQSKAEQLRDTMSKEYKIQGETLTSSPSIGISHYPTHGYSVNRLIQAADTAMYQAKRKGRNCVEIYTGH